MKRVLIVIVCVVSIIQIGNAQNFVHEFGKFSDEEFNEHWYNNKFAMPDVKEGSVIEISYKIKSPYLFNFRGWEFQNRIPVIFSEYTVNMIPFYEYSNMLQGANKFDGFRSYETTSTSSPLGSIAYNDMAYCYTMKDLPAFK